MQNKKASINYLFPSEKVNELHSWRFILHFKAPFWFRRRKTYDAIQALKKSEWKIIEFTHDLEDITFDSEKGTIGIPIEVSEEKRKQPNSLADYESDVWKIFGNMLSCGFGDLYYEAVDWRE